MKNTFEQDFLLQSDNALRPDNVNDIMKQRKYMFGILMRGMHIH